MLLRGLPSLVLAAALGACASSASESPWPVEPLETTRGPAEGRAPGGSAADAVEGGPFKLLRPAPQGTDDAAGGGAAQGGGAPTEPEPVRPELDLSDE